MRLYRYMSQYQTFRYIDALTKVTASYNDTYHRSIKMAPSKVTRDNQSEVWMTLHGTRGQKPAQKRSAFKFKIGDWVRISYLKKPFDREYREKWTSELFKVIDRDTKQGLAVYQLEDYAGESVTGTFYTEELQPVVLQDNAVYKIEKILRYRKRKGKQREMLVKWLGWGDKFNSWVTATDLERVNKAPT